MMTIAMSVQAQESVPATGTRPLNLSLPRDAVWSATTRSAAVGDELRGNQSNGLPDLGSPPAQRGRMPYGAGYEARQRGQSSTGNSSAGNTAGATGGQRGRGMGMGRGR